MLKNSCFWRIGKILRCWRIGEEFDSFLRIPNLFEFDHELCVHIKSDRTVCMQIDEKNEKFCIRSPPCHCCALNLMKMMSNDSNKNSKRTNGVSSFTLTSYSVPQFLTIVESILISPFHPNYLLYFLQSKHHLTRYLRTMLCLCSDRCAAYHESEEKDDLYNLRATVASFMICIGSSSRSVRWLIEANGGRIFKDLVVDRLKREWYLPIVAHIQRYHEHYLLRAHKKYKRSSGIIKENYDWIGSYANYCRLHSTCDWAAAVGKMALERKDEMKSKFKRFKHCDNRECPNALSLHQFEDNFISTPQYRRCGRCKMMNYCSRRCQKVDWNKFNHKSICFEYGKTGVIDLKEDVEITKTERQRVLIFANNALYACGLCSLAPGRKCNHYHLS